MVRRRGAPLVLAALLWAAGSGTPGGDPPCATPREQRARDGQTTVVECAGSGPPLRGAAQLLFEGRLDLNRAERASLELLPGIGPARAAAIEVERCRRRFDSPAELVRVRGIGRATAARLGPWLEAGPGAPAACGLVH